MSRFPPWNHVDQLVSGEESQVEAYLARTKADPRIEVWRLLDPPSPLRPARLFAKYRLPESVLDSFAVRGLCPAAHWVEGGYDYSRVLAPDDDGLSRFLEDVTQEGYEVAATAARVVREPTGRGRRDDGTSATPRQIDVAGQALGRGYYSWPRRVSGKELAEELELSTPTVLEHLRKFESKAVRDFLRRHRNRRALEE